MALLFNGRSYWDVHQHLKATSEDIIKPGFREKVEAEMAWVVATKTAVTEGRDVYSGLLQGGDLGARIAAAYLLGLIGASDIDTLEGVMKAPEGPFSN